MRRGVEPFDIELGRWLRLLRLSKGLSQQFVGAYLGISSQQVQKYERGENRLNVGFLIQLRDLYQVSLDSLIPDSGGTPPVPEFSRQTARLVSDFHAIRCGRLRGSLATLVRSVAASQPVVADRMRRASSHPTGTP